jgi:hypothetical protein
MARASSAEDGMSNEHRVRAREQLAQLLTLLRTRAGHEEVVPLIELGEQLDRAIASFHMEGIRFRMFTLGRLLHGSQAVPEEARSLYDGIRTSLEAAGFHTRSITG